MGFNLGDMLAGLDIVPESGTNREQIEYLSLDILDNDPNNFYELRDIEKLADNIATCGLQQPIRVRKHPETEGRYIIVSGHRRKAAVEVLAKEEPEKWAEVACIVESDAASESLRQLRLIYANAHTRHLTSAEISEQAVQVEKLLYQLKEEGHEFPGRMRDHVAEAVGASKSKLSRLNVIREKLIPCWLELFQRDELSESTAYALAQLPDLGQRAAWNVYGQYPRQLYADRAAKFGARYAALEKVKCLTCGSCVNNMARLEKMVKMQSWEWGCEGCCAKCPHLVKCKASCPSCAMDKDQAKADARNQLAHAKQLQAAAEQPTIDYIQGVYNRVGEARKLADKTVAQLYRAQKRMFVASDKQKQIDMEKGRARISVNASLPFGYSFRKESADCIVAVADLLNCSIDWLLGREGYPGPGDVPESGPAAISGETKVTSVPNAGWRTGDPDEPGTYVALIRSRRGGDLWCDDVSWNGLEWVASVTYIPEADVVRYWMPMPED